MKKIWIAGLTALALTPGILNADYVATGKFYAYVCSSQEECNLIEVKGVRSGKTGKMFYMSDRYSVVHEYRAKDKRCWIATEEANGDQFLQKIDGAWAGLSSYPRWITFSCYKD